METKVCKKCKKEKPYTEFHNNKRKKDNLNPWCKECSKKAASDYYYLHQEERKEWRLKNRDRCLMVKKEYRKNNKNKVKEYKKWYNETIEKQNPLWHFRSRLRRRIRESLKTKGLLKNKNTMEIIGCTVNEAKLHIEKQFRHGMCWENYGNKGWHIDHIIPLASGKTREEIYKLCHYTNLQPLWAEENYKKSDKIVV